MSRKPPKGKSLAEVNPELAKQWYSIKNGELMPEDVFAGSIKKVWWKCNKGEDHEWQAQINNRKNGDKCPFCSGRRASITNCLESTHPLIAKEWHPTKNGDLTPKDLTIGMVKKVWWKCPKGDDHEYEYSINLKSRGYGCPFCNGKKVSKNNSLGYIDEKLSKEWHPTKNGELTPFDITLGSAKKVWWKCNKGEDHEWQSTISNRVLGRGCSICAGRTVVKSNCLATVNPSLAKEWHPTKNGDLTPFQIMQGSNKKVWWKCPKGDDHEWEAVLNHRKNGTGCPFCNKGRLTYSNSLEVINPSLSKEFHTTKNGELTPSNFVVTSSLKVWWKCPKGDDHEWTAKIYDRNNGEGCHVCSGRVVVKSNCLATLNTVLSKEWHPTKNGELTPFDITLGSAKKVWWKCNKGEDHEWQASVGKRNKGRGCPICSGAKVIHSTSFGSTYSVIAKQWHPTRNGKLSPFDVSPKSSKKVWWKCDKGEDHEWKTTISSRSNGGGCAICSGYKVVQSNSLSNTHPKIARQWHPTKNGSLSIDSFMSGSPKKVWWKCDKGEDHEWKTEIRKRTSGRECPYCSLTPQSKQELTITFELSTFFNDIDPKGLKARVEGKIHSIDIFIPSLNLGVEFDGSYWHKGKRDLDKVKTLKFEAAGFNILRIREEPLKRIFESDIIAAKKYNGKEITDNLLKQIMATYKLDKRTITKIEKYLAKDKLQNEKALEKYIDQILTEKAEKKREKP